MSQPMGLPLRALTFLDEHAARRNPCAHCNRHDGYDRDSYAYQGMFDDIPLYEYTLKDGRIAQEFAQRTIWSSGPMIWLGLRIVVSNREDHEEILWPQSTFEEY